jgi:hypothetical protein
MNQLIIRKIEKKGDVSFQEADHLLEVQTIEVPVNTINWPQFPYLPKVSFRVGHTGNEIWLKFYVTEKYIRAMETKTNGAVHLDSCVEFFISLDNKNYYNFEFNCIGTTHLAYGEGRANRKYVPEELIDKIKIHSSLGNLPFEEKKGRFEWEMFINIPVECFAFDNISSIGGMNASGNFQKCGTGTSEPHYVTWNPIKTEKPDYHNMAFFGKFFFEEP